MAISAARKSDHRERQANRVKWELKLGDRLNLSSYVGVDPINFTDPLGLCASGQVFVRTGGSSVGGNNGSDIGVTVSGFCMDWSSIFPPATIARTPEPGRGGAGDPAGCLIRGDCAPQSTPSPEPTKPCGAPLPPASRTYPLPPGFSPSWDKQNRFVFSNGNKSTVVMNPNYQRALSQTGGTDWRGVGIDLLKIAGSVALTLRAGEIGSSLYAMFDVDDVARAGALVTTSGGKAVYDSVEGNQCRR